ncbi:DUF4145 domain-containing protein [Roseateles sp. P5_D6]
MHQLPENSVATWIADGPRSYPVNIGWMCPYCRQNVSFTAGSWRASGSHNWHASANCPLCKQEVQFFTMNIGTGFNSLCGGSLFMHPSAQARVPDSHILESERLAEPLKRAYRSAVNVVRVQEWNAAAVTCRRLLEGITKTALPAKLQKEVLAKQIEALPKHVDLGKPLLDLASAVRKGGNLGAHFSLEEEATEEVATLILDLCEDLIEYLFVLPERIDELNVKLAALGKTPGGRSPNE